MGFAHESPRLLAAGAGRGRTAVVGAVMWTPGLVLVVFAGGVFLLAWRGRRDR